MTFRADAYTEIGTGHVMRCLALANACRDADMATRFVGRIDDQVLRNRISQHGHEFVPAAAADWLAAIGTEDSWIVLDGYQFGSHEQHSIRARGSRLLVVDDMANLDSYEADILLNQNFHAKATDYHLACEAKMLMGTQYAMLRQEFDGRRPAARNTDSHRLLVTLGGSDPHGVSLLVLEALGHICEMQFDVRLIAGSSNPHLERLQTAVKQARAQDHIVAVEHYTDDMPGAMAWADMAVIAAGSTTLEVAYMGLPSLVLTLADNQAPIAVAMDESGVAQSLGWYDRISAADIAAALQRLAQDAPCRNSMTARGQALVDGHGAKRVVQAMLEQ